MHQIAYYSRLLPVLVVSLALVLSSCNNATPSGKSNRRTADSISTTNQPPVSIVHTDGTEELFIKPREVGPK